MHSTNNICTKPKNKNLVFFPNSCEVPDNWETNTTKPSNFNQQECNTTIQDNNISIPNINIDKLNNLSTGWHLLGTSTNIDNLSIFDNVDIVWKWNENSWEAYSSNNMINTMIKNNSKIDTLEKIEADKGFWINK